MTDEIRSPILDDAEMLGRYLQQAVRDGMDLSDDLRSAMIPPSVEPLIVEELSAWIPFPTYLRGEWREPTRWERLRWRIQDARTALRRRVHGILFPIEEAELRRYEEDY